MFNFIKKLFHKEQTKICKRCGQIKPVSQFKPNRKWDDGLSKWCIECIGKNKENVATPTKTKVCYRCREEKPVSEFHLNAKSADGLHTYCKPCRREYDKNRHLAKKVKPRQELSYKVSNRGNVELN